MPANWDPQQHLNTGRVEWPTGPIRNTPGNYRPWWVEAWVVQGGTMEEETFQPGPTQRTSHGPHWSGWGQYYRWNADMAGWVNGAFQTGPALGISLLALRDPAGNCLYEWWYDYIVLL
jgi:hypothetical protein